MKLYEIMGDYQKLYEMASDEEMSKEFEQTLQDTKESIDFSLEEKAYSYAKVCKNLDFDKSKLQGQADFLKKELENINAKIKSNENNKKRLLDTLSEAMQFANIDKFKNEMFTIYHSKNITVDVLDYEKALENGMATIEIKPDKTRIKKELQAGENLDFATLKEKKFIVIK